MYNIICKINWYHKLSVIKIEIKHSKNDKLPIHIYQIENQLGPIFAYETVSDMGNYLRNHHSSRACCLVFHGSYFSIFLLSLNNNFMLVLAQGLTLDMRELLLTCLWEQVADFNIQWLHVLVIFFLQYNDYFILFFHDEVSPFVIF